MNKTLFTLIAIFIIVVAAGIIILVVPAKQAVAPTTDHTPTATTTASDPLSDLIHPTSPAAHSAISSPVTVVGEARGTWYFEASFPVEILDANGKQIAQGPAQAQGDWMTENFVPFTISLTFAKQPAGSSGTIVLHKDNPSGDPAREQQISIPVTFK